MMDSPTGPGREESPVALALVRELLVNLPAAVAYVAVPDLVFQFANDEYRRIVGGRDLIGLPYREALPELAGQGRFEALDQVVETGEPFQRRGAEIWISQHGGEPEQVFLDYIYQPVRGDSGDVVGVLLFGTDVTAHVQDRRRVEVMAGQLATSEERYRTLFETLPLGVIHYRKDGSVIGANPAASQITGLLPDAAATWPVERTRQAVVHEDGSPFQMDELPLMVALRTGEVVPDVVVGMPHARTGEMRWLRVTTVPDARDEQGQPQRVYAIIADITEQHRAEATVREGTKLLGRLRDADILGVMAWTEQGLYDANDTALDIIGYSHGDVAAGRLTNEVLTAPEHAGQDQAALRQLRATGVFQPIGKEYIHRDGHRVPVLVGGTVTDWNPLSWVTFVVDLTARERGEREKAELRARAQAARLAAGAAQERLALLLQAGHLVTATGSREDLLDQAAQLMVPALADLCVVFLPTAHGTLQAASVAHRDPAGAAILEGLRQAEIPSEGPLIPQLAFTQATARLVPDTAASMPEWTQAAPKMARVLERVLHGSVIAAPLLIGHHPVGVLLLERGDGRPSLAETDMPVITELSRRLAVGLANVETFAREHTVAETLQHALLPDAPPEIPGLDLAASYLTATGGVQVGGDWYDAFPVGPGRVALAIGDVAGHSIESASIMGQVRSILRTCAIASPSPPDVLRCTNAAMSRLLPDALATACYAVLDVPSGDLAYANAGHPPALVFTGDGHAEYLDLAPGVILGASADSVYPIGRLRLPPRAGLLFYTDGLIESRQRDITAGLGALARALRHSAARTAAETCQSVQTALLGSAPRADDVCILAVRRPD